jgi:hypothetical protein
MQPEIVAALCLFSLAGFPVLYLMMRGSSGKLVKSSIVYYEGYEQAAVDLKEHWEQVKASRNRQKVIDHLAWLNEERKGLIYMSKYGLEPWKSGTQKRISEIDSQIEEAKYELRFL